MTRVAIDSNSTVRFIRQVLMNGARFSQHPMTNFNVHSGLVTKMRNSLESYQRAFRTHAENAAEAQARADAMDGSEEEFFTTLQTYLEQAAGHIHGAGRKEDIPELLLHLKLLVHETEDSGGFEEVARDLVVAANAVVDRF